MKEKIARRSVLAALGSAAVAGSTGCVTHAVNPSGHPVPPTVLPRVNLICHGMMLFWQDRANPTGGITIYAPDAMGMHIVSVSQQIGGVPNLLSGQGSYTLAFTCANTAALGPRDKNKNLVLYDPSPSLGLKVNAMNAQYVLSVPYPSSIRSFRTMKFGGNPPYSGNTASAFGIKPTQMAGLSVLTYDNVSSALTLAMMGGATQALAAPPLAPILNLHFYATTNPMITPMPSHLQFFNALLGYTGQPVLDLAVNNGMPAVVPPDQEQVDGDLSQLDVYDLSELNPGGRSSDPVGCIEGWGS